MSLARRGARLLVAVALILALAPPPPSLAQEAASGSVLALSEAVRLALENHWSIAAAEAQADIARADVDQALSGRLPRVQLGAGYMRTTNPVAVFGTLLRQERFGPENFDVGFLNEPDALGNWGVSLEVQQPIWTAGRLSNAAEAARLASRAQEASVLRTRQQVVHQAIRAWADAVLARTQVSVAREVIETARAHVGLVSDLRDGGLALEADVLRAQLRASEADEMLVRAESAVEVSTAALNLALGRAADTPVRVPATLPEPMADETPGLAELADGDTGRPDLDAADLRVAAARAGVDMARSQQRPQVGLMAAVEANDPDFFGFEGTNWTIGALASWTIFDGGEKSARQAKARAEAAFAEQMRQQLAHGIDVEIRAAWSAGRAARTRLEQARAAIAMAEESLRTVEDQYQAGMVTLVELLDAQTMLTRSRARQLAARRDLVVAEADLDLATGSLDTGQTSPNGARR